MERIEHIIEIDRPVEEVFRFIANPGNEPSWSTGLSEERKDYGAAIGVGATGHRVKEFLGRKMENDWEITEFRTNERIAMRSTSGQTSFNSVYSFESSAAGTKLTFVGNVATGGLFKIPEPIVSRMAKRQMASNLSSLKNLLESAESPAES